MGWSVADELPTLVDLTLLVARNAGVLGDRRNAIAEPEDDDLTDLPGLADDPSWMSGELSAEAHDHGTGGYVVRHDHIDDSCFTVGGSGRYVYRRAIQAGTRVRLVCGGAPEEGSHEAGGVLEGYRPTVLALE